jgi:hypothetical protein
MLRQSTIFASGVKPIALFSSVFRNFAFTEIKIRVWCAYPAPTGGAYRDRHGRWMRDAMDVLAA